ncbi:MAG: hypothetical protein JXB26_13930 [Candidatus Aminicenantes bacterium]|nr:hypothetical protein [Candidatus Aminicenantes bacterium]
MKKSAIFILCLALIVTMIGCGGKTSEEATPAKETKADETKAAQGKTYECEDFTMTLASDWEASPQTMGMVNVLPKGKTSPGLYFKFEGKGNAVGTAETSINTMINNYNGSPMESATIGNVEFKSTTYAYSGMTQTMCVAFREGTKITITLEGVGAKDNPDIKTMLSTVNFK